jgi:hypothetical protein
VSGHHCHALACETSVPPRLHMCARHWRMVPRLQRAQLWAAYRPGQERDKDPSAAYLRAAAACVEAVARAEGLPEDAITAEVAQYEAWASRVEDRTPR